MKILSYDEIDPTLVSILNRIGLNYQITADQIKEIRKMEKRLPKEFAWYMVDVEEVPIAQVSYLSIPLRSDTGRINVCVPQMVCILPEYSRKGIARKLMEYLHDYTKSLGFEYYFLSTSRSMAAEKLYESLGYSIFKQYHKTVGHLPKTKIKDIQVLHLEREHVNIIYEKFTQLHSDDFGFVYRPENLPLIREKWGDLHFNDLYVLRDNEGILGYIWSRGEDLMEIGLTRRYFDALRVFTANQLFYSSDIDITKIPRRYHQGFNQILTWSVSMVKSETTASFDDTFDKTSFCTPKMDLY